MVDERAGDFAQAGHAHQKHFGAGSLGELGVIHRAEALGRILVAGENRELRVVIAVGHRDAGVGWTGDGRADAGHDLEMHARRREFRRFLAAAAEDHRIAALEPDDVFAGLGFLDDQAVDFILRHRVVLGALADVDFLTTGLGPVEQFRAAERVVNEDVREFDAFLGAKGDEAKIAGAGADEITGSGFAHERELKSSSARVMGSVPRASPERGVPPSSGKTRALRKISPSGEIVENTPTGVWHPPSSRRRNSRSAVIRNQLSRWPMASAKIRLGTSPARTSKPIAPCPAAGKNSLSSSRVTNSPGMPATGSAAVPCGVGGMKPSRTR